MEKAHEEHPPSESGIDSDMDAIGCALKTVSALWDKYSAKVPSSFLPLEFIIFTRKVQQVEQLEYALQEAKDEAFLQRTEIPESLVSSTEEKRNDEQI